MPRSPRLAVLAALSATLVGCATVTVPPGPQAAAPVCADFVTGAPPELLGLDRAETSSQGTAAWGEGDDTVVMRCGVEPPGPTTDLCTRLEDGAGTQVDWVVREQGDVFIYTTYGREPAIDLSVPRAVAPDQPSAAALDLAQLVDQNLEATAYCVGAGDAG